MTENFCQLDRMSDGLAWRCRVCGRVYRTVGAVADGWQSRTMCGNSLATEPPKSAAQSIDLESEIDRRQSVCQQCPDLRETILPDDPILAKRLLCSRDLCDSDGRRRCDRRAAGIYAGRLTKQEPTCERWEQENA